MSEIYLSITETTENNNILPPGGALESEKYSSTSFDNLEPEIEPTISGASGGDYEPGIINPYSRSTFILNGKWYFYQNTFPLQLCQWENDATNGGTVSYDLEIIIGSQIYNTNDCVSCAASTAMQIFTYLATGVKERFSVVWLHGNHWLDSSYSGKTSGIGSGTSGTDDGAYIPEILDHLVSDGAVPFSLVYPELCQRNHLHYRDEAISGIGTARSFVSEHYSELIPYAQKYRLSSWKVIYKTYTSEVQEAISTYGCVLLNMYMSNDLENDVDGVISDVYPKYSGMSHVVCAVGWRTIGDKTYWICLNSWGNYYGDDGTWYIPIGYSKIINFYKMVPSISRSISWDKTKTAGNAFYVNAREWNRVEERLSRKLSSKGITFTPTRQFRYKPILATSYNNMITKVNSQLGTSYPTVVKNQPVSADMLNNLLNGVNAIT